MEFAQQRGGVAPIPANGRFTYSLSWILGSDELLDHLSKLDSLVSHFMKGDIECRSESRMEHALALPQELCFLLTFLT